jgi:hypothetical protein
VVFPAEEDVLRFRVSYMYVSELNLDRLQRKMVYGLGFRVWGVGLRV